MNAFDDDLERIHLTPDQLNLPATLSSGQTFRWRRTHNGEWIGAIKDRAVRLRREQDDLLWQTYPVKGNWTLVAEYFGLDVPLDALYEAWIEREPRIATYVGLYRGMRILRQDAEEAFFSFMCASCNTVVKITRTIRALEKRYGEQIAEIDGETLYQFPSSSRLADASEQDLRSDLWGFRAPRLIQAARHIAAQPAGWLEGLRHLPYKEAHYALTGLFGVGAKIADCVCLFGLWHDEAVPVDVHVRRVAQQLFAPNIAHRSLTPTVYWMLSDLVRERFGEYAGWAQQYLFYDDLRKPGIS